MWIFTTDGFFSVVAPYTDKQVLVVRARAQEDIENLHGHLPPDTKPWVETPLRDYRFRVNVDREVFAEYLSRQVLNLDYDNFKDMVHDRNPKRVRHYTNVWGVMYDMQVEGDIMRRRNRGVEATR